MAVPMGRALGVLDATVSEGPPAILSPCRKDAGQPACLWRCAARDSGADLQIADTRTEEIVPLTVTTRDAVYLAVSPDGQSIAFTVSYNRKMHLTRRVCATLSVYHGELRKGIR
jgi:hypothetical protein